MALLSSVTSVILVAPSVQAKSVQELVALAKARPGQFNFPSVGTGTAAHLSAELFNQAAGINAVHKRYRKLIAQIGIKPQ